MRNKTEGFGYISPKEFSHMKKFGILALALTFLTGTAVSTFAQAPADPPKKEKKKKKKTPPPDDKK
jgi:hypothetical protein